jgi:hypothetical protein
VVMGSWQESGQSFNVICTSLVVFEERLDRRPKPRSLLEGVDSPGKMAVGGWVLQRLRR